MVKMNFTENQTAFEYAMYMMFGSYFDKAVHKNKILEKKMRVQYMEQKEKNQIQMEDICIRFIEKKLMPQLPQGLWEQQVEVRILPTKKGIRDIQFRGPKYTLRVFAVYKGKGNTVIHYEVQQNAASLMVA